MNLLMEFLFIHSACVAVALLLPCALCDRIILPLQSNDRTSTPISTKKRTEIAVAGEKTLQLFKIYTPNLKFTIKNLVYLLICLHHNNFIVLISINTLLALLTQYNHTIHSHQITFLNLL